MDQGLILWILGLGSQKIDLLLSNSRQLLRKMKEAFPNYRFESHSNSISCDIEPLPDVDMAQCAWFQINHLLNNPGGVDKDDFYLELESALIRFLKIAQKVMSSVTSDYNLSNLLLGLFITFLVVLLSFPTTYTQLSNSRHAGTFYALSILGYGAMMFASSYVEEEQQFWNWAFTAWAFYLHVKTHMRPHCSTPSQHNLRNCHRLYELVLSKYGAVALLLSHRVLRRWNQTGQKFAAEPDIARSFLPSHRLILWSLVALSYADTSRHLLANRCPSRLWRLCCFTVTAGAFLLKLSYVSSDSPELLPEFILVPLRKVLDGGSLIIFTRLVLSGIFSLVPLSMYYGKAPQKQFVLGGMSQPVVLSWTSANRTQFSRAASSMMPSHFS